MTEPPASVDAYLASISVEARELLEAVRQALRSAAPNGIDVISYGIPGWRIEKATFSYAAFNKHCSLFGLSGVFDQFRVELDGHIASKGTIQFTAERPLDSTLIRRLVVAQLAENERRRMDKQK